MDLDSSLMKRIKRKKNMGKKFDEDKDVDTTVDEDKDIDTLEFQLTIPQTDQQSTLANSPGTQQPQDYEDLCVIPDTPSPIFSIFMGKRFHEDDRRQEEGRRESVLQNDRSPKSKVQLKFSDKARLKEEFKKPQRVNEPSKLSSYCQPESQPRDMEEAGSEFDSSHKYEERNTTSSAVHRARKSPSDTDDCVIIDKRELTPQKRFFERVSKECQGDPQRFQSVVSAGQEQMRKNALHKIKTIREKKKASAKRFFDELYGHCDDPGSPFHSSSAEDKEVVAESIEKRGGNSCSQHGNEKSVQEKKRKRIMTNAMSPGEEVRAINIENPTDSLALPVPRTVDHGTKKSKDSTKTACSYRKLRAEGEKKKSKNRDASINKHVFQPEKSMEPSLFPEGMLWPSESESDSDSVDSVPLREILNSNRERSSPCEEKNKSADSDEKKNSRCETKEEWTSRIKDIFVQSESEMGATGGIEYRSPKEKSNMNKNRENFIQNLKDIAKNTPKSVISPRSVISLSSDESLNQEDLEKLMADAFSPVSNDSPAFVRAVQQLAQASSLVQRGEHHGARYRHTDKSSRHRDRSAQSEINSDDFHISRGSNQNLVFQSPLVSNRVNNSRGDKSTHFPGLKRTRSMGSSLKGRPVRNRAGGRHDRASGFFPASMLCVSPEEKGNDSQDGEVVRIVEQLEGDEEYARKLQEEMDLEFAMSLQNMENQPPQEEQADRRLFPEFAGEHEFLNNLCHGSGNRFRGAGGGRSAINQFPGLEDLLTTSDSEESTSFEHLLPPTSPRQPRTRSRRLRAPHTWQQLHGNVDNLARMESHLLSLGHEFTEPPIPRGRRAGRRGNYFPGIAVIRSPSVDGNDYEDLLNLAEMLGDVKKRGLSQVQASRLPERKFIATNNSEDNLECMICMCEYEMNDNLRKLPCFHEFHSTCIDKWIMGNATCPICRVEVKF